LGLLYNFISGWLKVSGFVKKATWLPPDPDTKHLDQNLLKFARASFVGNWNILSDVVEESNPVDEVEHNPITSDGGGETLAYCLFDTKDIQPKVVWCIALVADRVLVLEYLPQQDVHQRVGFFVHSDPV
jgi:hypothetical protein